MKDRAKDHYLALRQAGVPQGVAALRAGLGRTSAFYLDRKAGIGSRRGPRTDRISPRPAGAPPDGAVPPDRPEPPPPRTRDEYELDRSIERDRRYLGEETEDLDMREWEQRVPSAPLPQIEITEPEELRDVEHRPLLRAVDHPAGVQTIFYSAPPTDIRERPRPGAGRPSYADGQRLDPVSGIRLPPDRKLRFRRR